MRQYRGIYLLMEEEHASALLSVEKLASQHKEYRSLQSKIARCNLQEREIDLLLDWKFRLTHEKGCWDYINYDLKRTTYSDRVFEYLPKEESKYAGRLGDEGESETFKIGASGSTFFDLYMEVIQLIAYHVYNIPAVVPISACDVDNPCASCGWATCKGCPHANN